MRTFKRIQEIKNRQEDKRTDWYQCIPAVVAENEDPDHMHRIKVRIPLLTETEGEEAPVEEDWVRQIGFFAGSQGFGMWAVPAVGSTVLLFSEFGEGVNWYYACMYNENSKTPGAEEDESVQGWESAADIIIRAGARLVLEGGDILIKSKHGAITIDPAGRLITHPPK